MCAGLNLWRVKVHVPLQRVFKFEQSPNQLPHPSPRPSLSPLSSPSPSLSTRTKRKNDNGVRHRPRPSPPFRSGPSPSRYAPQLSIPRRVALSPYSQHYVSSFLSFMLHLTDIYTFCTHSGLVSHTASTSRAASLGMFFLLVSHSISC